MEKAAQAGLISGSVREQNVVPKRALRILHNDVYQYVIRLCNGILRNMG